MPISAGPPDIRSDLLYETATAPAGQPQVYKHRNLPNKPPLFDGLATAAAARAAQPSYEEAWAKATVAGAELLIAEATERESRKREAEKKAEKERKMREAQKQKSESARQRRDASKAKQDEIAQKQKQAMIAADRRAQQAKKKREEEEWRKVFEKCKADKEKAERQRALQQFNEEHAALTREINEAVDRGKPFDFKRMIDWIAKVEASGIDMGLTPEQWARHKYNVEEAYAAQRLKDEEETIDPNPTQGRGGGKGRGRGRGRGGRGGPSSGARGGGTCPDKQPEPPAPEPEPSEEASAVRRAQEERYKALKAAATTAASAATSSVSSVSSPPAAPPKSSAEGNNDDECVICWNATATHVVVPCGHLCMCPGCVPKELESCPVCRGPMAHVMKVYRP